MKFPLAPLIKAFGPVYAPQRSLRIGAPADEQVWCQIGRGMPSSVLWELTGVHRRQLQRWARDGLSWETADRLAVALGFHPYEVWPEWFDCYPPERHTTAVECPQAEKEGTEDG